MSDVFLSYAQEDAALAARLTTMLEKNHLTVFDDRGVLVTGESFAYEIAEAIDDATTVLVLLSKHAKRSRWVEEDLACALHKSPRVLPILLDSEAKENWVWPLIADRVAMQFEPQQGLEELVRNVKSAIESSPSDGKIHRVSAGVSRDMDSRIDTSMALPEPSHLSATEQFTLYDEARKMDKLPARLDHEHVDNHWSSLGQRETIQRDQEQSKDNAQIGSEGIENTNSNSGAMECSPVSYSFCCFQFCTTPVVWSPSRASLLKPNNSPLLRGQPFFPGESGISSARGRNASSEKNITLGLLHEWSDYGSASHLWKLLKHSHTR